MKPKHQRLAFIGVSMVFLCLSVLLTMRAFKDNLIFFYSPSDIGARQVAPGRPIRIGGLVATGSIQKSAGDRVVFDVTDGKASVTISYRGILPNLFREGQGVVAEGTLADATHLDAKTILAKHDENYMPREVVDSLKRTGHWKGESPATPATP